MSQIGLVDVVQALRAELARASEQATGADVRFPVGQVTLEFQVGVTRSAEAHGGVRFWVLELGASAGVAAVWALAVTPDAREIVSGGGDGLVMMWPLTGSGSPRILGRHREPVRSVDVSPDGSRVVSGSADGTVHIWDRSSGHAATPSREAPVTCAAVGDADWVGCGTWTPVSTGRSPAPSRRSAAWPSPTAAAAYSRPVRTGCACGLRPAARRSRSCVPSR